MWPPGRPTQFIQNNWMHWSCSWPSLFNCWVIWTQNGDMCWSRIYMCTERTLEGLIPIALHNRKQSSDVSCIKSVRMYSSMQFHLFFNLSKRKWLTQFRICFNGNAEFVYVKYGNWELGYVMINKHHQRVNTYVCWFECTFLLNYLLVFPYIIVAIWPVHIVISMKMICILLYAISCLFDVMVRPKCTILFIHCYLQHLA